VNQFGDYAESHNGQRVAQYDHERVHYYNLSTSPILYVADFQDLFLTKIGVQELIEKVEEVVLRADA
jgi:hypothetical protein